MSNTQPWPAEMTDRLRVLAAAGMSAGQIAAVMGITRNAVIGKAMRSGIVFKRALGRIAYRRARRLDVAA